MNKTSIAVLFVLSVGLWLMRKNIHGVSQEISGMPVTTCVWPNTCG